MLKIEDLKLGGELVCVDRNGLHNEGYACAQAAKLDKYIITGLCKQTKRVNFMIEHDMDWKDSNYLLIEQVDRFFKKKEQSQYTFDGLIDVAVKAKKDGVLKYLRITDDAVIINTTDRKGLLTSYASPLKPEHYEGYIKYIQSLYKETFVIECEEDIKRIKKGAEITLSNSNKSKVSVIDYDENTLKVANWDYFLQFFSLKGATVEQERGRDD